MTDADPSDGASRRRPSYGLPDPQAGDPAAGQGQQSWSPAPQQGAYGQPAPQGYGSPAPQGAYGSPAPQSHQGYDAPQDVPAQPGYGGYASPQPGYGAPTGGYGGGPAAPRKRRGVWPLVIGIVLLVVSVVVFIGGIVWSMSSLVGDTMEGPIAMEGGTAEIQLEANEMVIVYVPSEDTSATCTAEGDGVSTVPTSGSVQFPDGTTYEQSLGVVSTTGGTITISCTDTEAPGYLGPYSLFGIAAPLIIGPVIGIVLGLIGLILVIVGIVKLVRSRR